MAGENQEDSFEEYKKYLVQSIGDSGISRPPRIMNPFQIFCLQRQSKERKEKGKLNLIEFNKTLSEEWKSLSDSKKEYYQKVYEIRKTEYDDVKRQYDLLTNRTKPPSAYIIYYRKRYPIVSEEHKTAGEAMITKMIAADWGNLSPSMKSVYEQQAQIQKKKRSLDADEKKEFIEVYEDKVKALKLKILEDKQKILKKYELPEKKKVHKQTNKKAEENKKNQKLEGKRQTEVKKEVQLVSQPKQSEKVKVEEEAKKTKRSKSEFKSKNKKLKENKKEKRSKSEPPKSKETQEEKIKVKKEKSSSKKKTVEKASAKKKIIKKTQKTTKTIKFQSILPSKNKK